MKIYLICLIFVFSVSKAFSQDSTKILFIGNSLTYYNDMPQMLQKMLNMSTKKYFVYQKTEPGIRLKEHLSKIKNFDPSLNIETFKKEKFSFVVLQEASVRLLVPQLNKELFYVIDSFNEIVKENSGKLLFYQPYPAYVYPYTYCFPNFKTGDSFCSEQVLTSEQEMNIYKSVCDSINKKFETTIIPVGEAFQLCKKEYSTYPLLVDEQHPSRLGSYLIAYLFYISITSEKAIPNFYYLEEDKSSSIDIINIVNNISKK